jgi:tripartite-type tricarboxylate transporter receptor subunit TctC
MNWKTGWIASAAACGIARIEPLRREASGICKLLFAVFLGSAVFLYPASTRAEYPDRPVRLIVGFAPGGPTDILARALAPALGKRLGQQVIVENKPGASGVIGVESVLKAPADGYTILVASEVDVAILPNLSRQLPYDPARDLVPVVAVAEQQSVLVVRPGSGIDSLQDFLARAKASPGKMSYASGGKGTPSHMLGAMFAVAAGVDLVHVPYKGAGPASVDLLGGHVDAMFLGGPTAVGQVRSGNLKALAVTGKTRSAPIPGVPTFTEAGIRVADFDDGTWWALVAAAGVPPAILDRLSHAWKAAASHSDTIAQLEKQGLKARSEDGKTVAEWIARDYRKWARVVKASGISRD